MPRKAVWSGSELWNLLNLSYRELLELYPQYNKNTLKGKRAYWKNKVLNGEVKMPEKEPTPTANQSYIEKDGDNLVSVIEGWYEVVTKDAEGVAHTHRLYKHSAKSRPDLSQEYPQATPARITPTKRKPVDRDYKTIYVFSDAQIDYRRLDDGTLQPLHDERALAVGRMICRDVRPDVIINLGDMVDLTAFGQRRYGADSDHFTKTLAPSFQRAHDYYAELRADNPDAEIIEVDSNHNTRLSNFVKNEAPMFYGLKRPGEDDYPVMSYGYLANLGHVGVKWISGYPAAEYVYGQEYGKPPIVFKHGKLTNSSGSVAKSESNKNAETHIVRGHTHSAEMVARTNRAGQYLTSIVVGVSCNITGEVPSYHSAVDDNNRVVKYQENQQQGVLVVRDYGGDYEFVPIAINKGVAYYNGKRYEA